MRIQTRSTITFFVLLAVLAGAVILNAFLPQGEFAAGLPASTILTWQLVLAGAGINVVVYGLLGFLGLTLWRKLGFPDIWAEQVSNRQRFLVPALLGGGLGLALIALDLLFSAFNGVGRIIHPPFPTSLVASLSAGIGEEMLFRLFFVSLWTWLVGKVILRGRGLPAVFAVVSVFSAFVHAASHLPTLMALTGASDLSGFSPWLLLEILLMNGLISLFAAFYMKKSGFFAAAGIHFWTDVVWHVLWGLV